MMKTLTGGLSPKSGSRKKKNATKENVCGVMSYAAGLPGDQFNNVRSQVKDGD